jgi:20S proteasome subunit beta 6
VKYASQGAGQKLIIPILDNVVGHKNRNDAKVKYTVSDVVELVKDVFITAGEREIMVGDSIVYHVITKDGIKTDKFDLKKD